MAQPRSSWRLGRRGVERREERDPPALGQPPSTATQSLTNTCRDVALDLTKEVEALPPRQRIVKVAHTVVDMGFPAVSKRYDVSEVVRRRMDHINRD